MPENLELFRKLRRAHRGVATKLYNEADGIMNKPFTLLNEDDLIQLQQIVELWKKKQAFLSEQKQKIQSIFDYSNNLDDKTVETEEYDDKICQNIDNVFRFVQRNTRHSSQERSFAAGSTMISRNMQNINLPKLDLPSFSGNCLDWISFFNRFNGAVIDNGQLTNSLRLQYLKSAVKLEASKMLTSITVTDDNFDSAMEISHNRYDNIKIDTVSPHPWNCLLLTSFKWKHAWITKTCRHDGGAQTFSSKHGTTSWASGPLFSLLYYRKTAHRNTKVRGTFFKGEKTTDLSGTKDFPAGTCSSLGVSGTKQKFIKYRKMIKFATKSSTETTSH